MRIFAILRLMAIVMVIAGAFLPGNAVAQDSSHCSGIASDLSAAIQKDRAKTLMLLEDALVINEACAGEIVTAALLAHAGDADMEREIVETSINVAPKMAAAINDAAGGLAPAATSTVAAVQPPDIDPVISGEGDRASDDPEAEDDADGLDAGFASLGPSSIRGVYLVQPPPSGLPASDTLRKFFNVATSPCTCTP